MEESRAHGHCGCSPAWAPYFGNERHADVTVVCRDGLAIRAHKLVLSLGSPYFDKALNPAHNFKESQRNEVHLHDEDPAVVKAVLQFIYTSDYTCASMSRPSADNDDDDDDDDNDNSLAAPLTFHAAMHAAAGYFLMPALADAAFARFEALVAATDWPRTAAALPGVIAFIYDNSPPGPRSPSAALSPSPCPMPSASPFITSSTTTTGSSRHSSRRRRLRDLAVALCATHFDALSASPRFSAMMDRVGAFGRELAALLARRNAALAQAFGGRRFLCTFCVDRYCVARDGCEALVCGFCRRGGEVVALRD